MGSQLDGHNSGDGIENQAKIHDLALEQLKECIDKTDSVTLLSKLFQNPELKNPAFERLCYLGFDRNIPEALNEIVQITQLAKNELAAKKGNKKAVLAKIESKK